MQCRLAIFDLDGTLLDTLEDLKQSTNFALRTLGYPERTLEEVRRFVGNGIRLLIERSAPEGASKDDVDALHQCFTAHYEQHCADHTAPYPGICALLRTLRARGIKTAVVSNKADYAVQILCETYFAGLLDFAVGERPGIQKKPAPDAVNAVLEKLHVARDDAIYIGDSEVDVQTAQRAKMRCVCVTWGFRSAAVLKEAGAQTLADTAKALEAQLLRQ